MLKIFNKSSLNWRVFVWVIFVLSAAVIAVYSKSIDIQNYPYLLDGDPYFHANVIRYITEYWQFPSTVPNQIPVTNIFYPMGFHLVYAIVVKITSISEFQLLRWGGPATAGLLTISMFFLARRLSLRPIFLILVTVLTVLLPIFTPRLAITLPEGLFLLSVVWALQVSTYVFSRPTLRNVILLSFIAGLGLFFHFSGYILAVLPIVGWSYFLWLKIWHRKFWQFCILVAALIGFFWLILHLRPELWKTVESFSNRNVANPEFMAQPQYAQWLEAYGWLPMILLYIGIFYLVRLKDRRWWGVLIWGISSVAFIDLLPRFDIYNLLPFRGFPYFALALIPIAAYGGFALAQRRKYILPMVILGLLLSLPIRQAGWDKDVTTLEYTAMQRLGTIVRAGGLSTALVVTQPINGRPITYFDKVDTISDAAVNILHAPDFQTFVSLLPDKEKYRDIYVYISKYKLGPEYNKDWTRPWAAVNLNQRLFWDQEHFSQLYENDHAIVFKARI